MIYNQPLSTRFGDELNSELSTNYWRELIVAVAWVRRSGITHLTSSLERFLKNGGFFKVIVGIDLNNTSKEGLEALLELHQFGNCEFYVHHNEAGGVFHPKMYLFKNEKHAKLIVGSNNITQSGLYQNTEVGLHLDLSVEDAVIRDAEKVFSTWSSTESGVVNLLTDEFLVQLFENGYVQLESQLVTKIITGKKKYKKDKLFGSIPVPPPSLKKETKGTGKGELVNEKNDKIVNLAVGQVLLMRVRKAHAVNRPTQTQVPINLARSDFFHGIDAVTSTHDYEKHQINAAYARGNLNTMKLEIPEMREYDDPVIRFTRDDKTIYYEAYDRSTPQGYSIMESLERGREKDPPQTTLTKPSTPETSTWWRFI